MMGSLPSPPPLEDMVCPPTLEDVWAGRGEGSVHARSELEKKVQQRLDAYKHTAMHVRPLTWQEQTHVDYLNEVHAGVLERRIMAANDVLSNPKWDSRITRRLVEDRRARRADAVQLSTCNLATINANLKQYTQQEAVRPLSAFERAHRGYLTQFVPDGGGGGGGARCASASSASAASAGSSLAARSGEVRRPQSARRVPFRSRQRRVQSARRTRDEADDRSEVSSVFALSVEQRIRVRLLEYMALRERRPLMREEQAHFDYLRGVIVKRDMKAAVEVALKKLPSYEPSPSTSSPALPSPHAESSSTRSSRPLSVLSPGSGLVDSEILVLAPVVPSPRVSSLSPSSGQTSGGGLKPLRSPMRPSRRQSFLEASKLKAQVQKTMMVASNVSDCEKRKQMKSMFKQASSRLRVIDVEMQEAGLSAFDLHFLKLEQSNLVAVLQDVKRAVLRLHGSTSLSSASASAERVYKTDKAIDHVEQEAKNVESENEPIQKKKNDAGMGMSAEDKKRLKSAFQRMKQKVSEAEKRLEQPELTAEETERWRGKLEKARQGLTKIRDIIARYQ